MSYFDFIKTIVPTVLRTEPGRRFVGVMSLTTSMLAESYREAVRASWIGDSKIGPAYDALSLAGSETSLPRYLNETWDQYHARLQRVWEDWPHAGVESSILGQLDAAGFPSGVFYSALPWGWPTRPPLNWPDEVAPEEFWWSKFWIFFPAGTHSVTADGPIAGDGHNAGDPGLVAGPVGITGAQMKTIRMIVGKFKPGHWRGFQVVFELEGPTAGTGHLAGEPGLVAGTKNNVVMGL